MDGVELGKELWSCFKCPISTPSHGLAEEVKDRFGGQKKLVSREEDHADCRVLLAAAKCLNVRWKVEDIMNDNSGVTCEPYIVFQYHGRDQIH